MNVFMAGEYPSQALALHGAFGTDEASYHIYVEQLREGDLDDHPVTVGERKKLLQAYRRK
jgi:hypothetical protein